jgi:hypothetical protein
MFIFLQNKTTDNMVTKTYSAPLCEVRKSGLRASILAGSNNPTTRVVTGHDFSLGARQRVNTSGLDDGTKLFEY